MSAATRARSVRRLAVLAGAGLGAVALSATPTHAVIGVGNPTAGNACANGGTSQAAGATQYSTGSLAGNVAQLPVGLPRNDCGNSGLTCVIGGFEL
jgi:hypothetical protein